MTDQRIVQRLAAIAFWLVCGIVVVTVVMSVRRDQEAGVHFWPSSEVSGQHDQSKYVKAIRTAEQSLALARRRYGEEHRSVASSMLFLALLYRLEGRDADAAPLLRRSLAITEKVLFPDAYEVETPLQMLGALSYAEGDWAGAAGYWRRSTALVERRAARDRKGDRPETSTGKAQHSRGDFLGLVKATYRLAAQSPNVTAPADMFEKAQWAQFSKSATSLAQMAARSAKNSPQLGELARERQDLVDEWDRLLAAVLVKAEDRSTGAEEARTKFYAAIEGRRGEIDRRLSEIDRQLAQEFPEYAALVSAAPVSTEEAQAQLGVDEALVLVLDTPEFERTPEETFIWVVTKSDVRWARSAFGTTALRREVEALRCGLDNVLWDDKDSHDRCMGVVKAVPYDTEYGGVLPFDLGRAHALYKALLGPAEDLIAGKHLLIVPSGALTQLPFQVLVTEPPGMAIPDRLDDYRVAAWLGVRQPLTVLPAVSSLKALRRVGRPSAAPRPMIGFGNPLLDGYLGRPDDNPIARKLAEDHAQWRAEARAKQRCEPAGITVAANTNQSARRVASPVRAVRGVVHVTTRGGLADLDLLKGQVPLPETADELCAVAEAVQANAREIRLGAQATEREVKRLSRSGELTQYRMLHFATHGAAAGELRGTDEPGLILTPPTPEVRSEEDDGYLSASEIADLKLDADLVVLSACNTAAGGETSAEALSGLASAFIYAGARALLVSHWAVASDATVEMIKAAVAEMARDAKVGRAEAMRRAMQALIERGTHDQAHPSYWAPFVVVGEGAAGQ
jgi:CHAT domain-containing protein